MMVVSEKNEYKTGVKVDKAEGSVVEFDEKEMFHLPGHLSYKQSSVGVDVYVPEDVRGILILEPVRNLKLKLVSGDELTINCVAGTVCVIPADQAVVITWPEPVFFLNIKLNNLFKRKDIESKNISIHDKISIFSSKRCLQIGKIISEQLDNNENIDLDFIKSLHIVINNIIAKSYLLSREASVINTGLSSYACRQIESYLKENFRGSVLVSDMADYLGMSSGHFASCFRESFGQTPHQYLMNLRLDDAEKCLKETDIPISEIAAGLNFSSQSHLTTALKKYRQLTPGEIRRRSSFNRRRS